MKISYQLSRVDDSDLWLALALLLCAFEKNVFVIRFWVGAFLRDSKNFYKHKREKRSKTGEGR